MKTKPHLTDYKFAGHLRYSMDKPLWYLRIAFYILLAIVGFLMAITTNAKGIRYDTNDSMLYKHSYRVETTEALSKKIATTDSHVYDFTKPIPDQSLLNDYDFDCASILKENVLENEIIVGLPKKSQFNPDKIKDIYIPGVNFTDISIKKTFINSDLIKDTIYLPASIYHIYNKAYESIKNGNLIINNDSISLLNIGYLSSQLLDADIYYNINDNTLNKYISISSFSLNNVGKATFNLNNINYTLTIKIVDTPTCFNFKTFSDFDVLIGKTILYNEIKDSFLARQFLLTVEDSYKSFNTTYLNGKEYDSTYYTVGSFTLIGVYVVLITSIMICASKSHKDIKRLAKLGMNSNISINQYAKSTILISLIAVLITYAIAFSISSIFEKYGSILWLNVFDFLMILIIEAIVASLDIFVASRSVLWLNYLTLHQTLKIK